MQFPIQKEVEFIRKSFPVGCRIELVEMGQDPYSKLKPGDQGTVRSVDDTGTVFVDWDCGSGLGMVYGVDIIKRVDANITMEQIKNGYKSGVVRLEYGPGKLGTVCQIGEHWFYFGGLTAEDESPDEYRRNIPEEDIILKIWEAVTSFQKDFSEEYLYYYFFLKESGC